MKRFKQSMALLIVPLFIFAYAPLNAAPQLIDYQALITDDLGNPINDTVDITFKIYKDSTGGIAEWVETHPDIDLSTITVPNISLGGITPFPLDLFDNDELWLGITIAAGDELAPRTRLKSVPYALRAEGVNGHFHSGPGSIYIPDISGTDTVISFRRDDIQLEVPAHCDGVEMSWLFSTTDTAVRIDTSGIYLPGTELRSVELVEPPQKSLEVKSGDLILTNKYAGTEIKMDGQEHVIVRESDLAEIVKVDTTGVDLLALDGDPLSVPPIPVQTDPRDLSLLNARQDLSDRLFRMSWVYPDGFKVWNEATQSNAELLAGKCTFMTSDGVDTNLVIGNAGLEVHDGSASFTGSGGSMTSITDSGWTIIDSLLDGVISASVSQGFVFEIFPIDQPPVPIFTVQSSAADLATFDIEADGVPDVLVTSSPSERLWLTSGIELVCDGPATHTSTFEVDVDQDTTPEIAVSDSPSTGVTINNLTEIGFSTCVVSGNSPFEFRWDFDGDATDDMTMNGSPTPELTLATGTELRCDGPATHTNTFEIDVDQDTTPEIAVVDSPSVGVKLNNLLEVGFSACVVSGNSPFTFEWDFDGNATNDMTMSGSPAPTFTLESGTDFDCLGSASFDRPVFMSSDLTVGGALTVSGPKSFVQEHPDDDKKEIVFVALEGDEAGTYTRGTSRLKDGVAEIELSEGFRLVTHEDGLTAQVTPREPVRSMLYVESVTPTRLVVKASNSKDNDVRFDFTVNGVRTGYENHEVVRDKANYSMK